MVINMINIRERKYEIGVLRTIGMKKSKVSLQFMFLLLGAGIGSITSVPVANSLLANEIENANSKYENIDRNFGHNKSSLNSQKEESIDSTEKSSKTEENKKESTTNDKVETSSSKERKQPSFGIARVEQVDDINAVVDLKVLAELLGIGLLLTLIGSLASMIAISRFSPLTILKERS